MIDWLKHQLWCEWLIELSDNKLSNNNLASELEKNSSFFKPITIKKIVILMITIERFFKFTSEIVYLFK